MKKPFIRLRIAIMEADLKQDELAAAIAVNPSTFSKKMTAKTAWTLWEAYKLLDVLGLPAENLTEYFPSANAVPYDNVASQLAAREKETQ